MHNVIIQVKNLEIDENILKNICFYSRNILSPICSILASIVVFESIKITGKYNPLKEFFYLNFFDILPEN
jgi:hypothetical protein